MKKLKFYDIYYIGPLKHRTFDIILIDKIFMIFIGIILYSNSYQKPSIY